MSVPYDKEAVYTPHQKRIRLSAIVPAVFSIAALVLTILTAIAGSKPGVLNNGYLMSINTTGLGHDIIEIEPASSSSSGSSSNDPLSQLGDAFGNLVSNITSEAGDAASDMTGDLIQQIAQDIGIAKFYNVYLRTICTSNSTTSEVDISKCESYESMIDGTSNALGSIPSSATIGPVKVTVPFLESFQKTGGTLSSFATIIQVIFAFLIIAVVSNGIVTIISLLDICLASSRLLIRILMVAATLAVTFSAFAAFLFTIMFQFAETMLGTLGGMLGITSKQGKLFYAFIWIALVATTISSTYWYVVWFVEFRRRSFRVRRRSPEEIGNYRGIKDEMAMDLLLSKQRKIEPRMDMQRSYEVEGSPVSSGR